ncbi:MAG: DUF4012 domain-containing protein [Candidatus Gracilibacteria bacterium]
MINLDIGPETPKKEDTHKASKYVLNLKSVDSKKHQEAHSTASVDLKEEIKSQNKTPGRIQIVGSHRIFKNGLGRIPMLISALAILLVLNLGQIVFLGKQEGKEALALAGEGFVSLQNAGESFVSNGNAIDLTLFDDAQKLFNEAKEKGSFLLNSNSPWLTEPKEVQSLKKLIEAGSLMTEVGTHLGRAKLAIESFPQEGSLTEYFKSISEQEIEPASTKINQIIALLDGVDLSKTGYQDQFEAFKEKIGALASIMNIYIASKEPLLTALGNKYPQHYLVLLQNNDEMRLGGGFIGSFAIVEINDGRLTAFDFHDVYEFDNRYFEDLEVPVHELENLTSEWRLRDSNTSPDFPTSAKNAMWFLEQEGGPGVDGVIAVNLSVAKEFLNAVGGVKIDSLQKDLTGESFSAVITTLVEAKVNKSDPKTILKEALNAFLEKAKDGDALQKLGAVFFAQANNKQILFYHKDAGVQTLLESFDFDGEIPKLGEATGDFFMPLFTNIGANKTDHYINTNILHNTQILDDGSEVATITLTRTHTFTEDTLKSLKEMLYSYGFSEWNTGLEGILGNAQNKTGIRFYVPEGSRIIGTTGIYRDDIQYFYDKDQDVSYYYFEQVLSPGEAKEIAIQFALPFEFFGDFKEYDFSMFKQPGLQSTTFKKTVTAQGGTLLSEDPLATTQEFGSDYTITGALENDISFKLLYQ